MSNPNHKIKIGDDIQICADGRWWIGFFGAVYDDHTVLLKKALPLYPIGKVYNKEDVKNLRLVVGSLWVYTGEYKEATLTHNGADITKILDPSVKITPAPPKES
jgi:hypothetical protein